MNRQQFLAELSQYLTFFSPEERANVIAAYNEKFDAAGQENEYSLIAELGTPMMTAIDLKRRMESGEKIALACEPEATQPEALSEYSVETETEASLVAIAEIQEATPVEAELAEHLAVLRDALKPEDGTQEDYSLCAVETFAAVAMRVMRASNPSKVRDCARTVEIKARLDGLPVIVGLSS